ncbi:MULTISPECIES: hypothetical protein [unclassified Shimia]|uniref:hypothetical protein n=1 Tax=unclassified Shimia TaxID=2630038 RepID=UPI001AD9D1D9|nr:MULTISPECIES: hypothetical protein [unclassified Shimia]MBO9472703.1 hypothetical protein [Shimia sp. R10_1]MDA5556387.1 hypothetical protein [Shimia sp. MMG029]
MRRFALTTSFAALIAAPSFALTVAEVDQNGDSLISFDEMATVYPSLTPEAFNAVDTSGDSAVDEDELTAALESGLIVAPAE